MMRRCQTSRRSLPRACLPVVRHVRERDPDRPRENKEITERCHIRLILPAHFCKLCVGLGTLAERHSNLLQSHPNQLKIRCLKTVQRIIESRSLSDHLRKINDCMSSHGKGEPRLPRRDTLDPDYDQRAGVEHCGQRSEPGLVAVLRTVVKEHRI